VASVCTVFGRVPWRTFVDFRSPGTVLLRAQSRSDLHSWLRITFTPDASSVAFADRTPATRILDDLGEISPRSTQTELRSLLGCFLFSADDVDRRDVEHDAAIVDERATADPATWAHPAPSVRF